ncbi:MAG: MBL fold metallo-hydrolase [Erysipelotrichaceae bacterium]|nr:MBL fold metallo-hydrolase [Erysipelotrichaceae bacterium]
MFGQNPREIKSNLKTKKLVWEEEKPIRWSYLKILREHSDLKQEFPELNPYVESYKMRDNLFCLYTESLDGAGDPWMYLIVGPKKALLIDTGFGLGDLKALCNHLSENKELIVVNTHAHFDHAYGNGQFDLVYCHEAEVSNLEQKNNPDIWNYLFDKETGKPLFTDFDRRDLISPKHYEIHGIPDGYEFDLGDGYIVEAVHIPGHTSGQCAYYDRRNKTIFIGDVTGIGSAPKGHPYRDFYTVEAMYDALKRLKPRFPEINGVFPGHGMIDLTNSYLQYLLNCTESILRNPSWYDDSKIVERWGNVRSIYFKNIHQGTSIRYSEDSIYKSLNSSFEKKSVK